MKMIGPALSAMIIGIILMAEGCSMFRTDNSVIRTRIIPAVRFGTTFTPEFKAEREMPCGHIIWGNDVSDGSNCRVVITNTTLAKQVYRHEFVYHSSSLGKGYNYSNGAIIEPDPEWNHIGRYTIELFINGNRWSGASFTIVP